MPRYAYDRLCISCLHPVEFDPSNPGSLRAAVDYLRWLPEEGFISLLVEVTVKAGNWKLRAPASLKMSQIRGKRPSEVWEELDRQVDAQIRYFEIKAMGKFVP